MSRLDHHLRWSKDPQAVLLAEEYAEEAARPEPVSDMDSYRAGLRDEDSRDYWMEAGR